MKLLPCSTQFFFKKTTIYCTEFAYTTLTLTLTLGHHFMNPMKWPLTYERLQRSFFPFLFLICEAFWFVVFPETNYSPLEPIVAPKPLLVFLFNLHENYFCLVDNLTGTATCTLLFLALPCPKFPWKDIRKQREGTYMCCKVAFWILEGQLIKLQSFGAPKLHK